MKLMTTTEVKEATRWGQILSFLNGLVLGLIGGFVIGMVTA